MKVSIEPTGLPGVVVLAPEAFQDERGFFVEVYRRDTFAELGLPSEFVQLNHSKSAGGVLRGLHFQWDPPMGKLMRVTQGRAFLVAVDIRQGSPNLGHWAGVTLDAAEKRQVWAPAGFARGFCVLSDAAEIEYLCTGTYNGAAESGILWSDPEIGIDWPISDPVLSAKDRDAQTLSAWLKRPEAAHFTYAG
jgi:dTDP-4-dehydrorhamnose 3,5-epimerase